MAYFWTAIAAICANDALGLQYDGGLGWWVLGAYSFPALVVAAPLRALSQNPRLGDLYCLAVLAIATGTCLMLIARKNDASKGS
jgi:hypothetical protein